MKETDLRTGFTNVFKSLGTRETLNRATLQPRLLLCLYGLGTNAGVKRMVSSNPNLTYRELLYIRHRFIEKNALREAIRWVVNAMFLEYTSRSMSKHVVIYARVSTGEQIPDHQLKELRTVADRMSWQVARKYIDHGISSAKGRDQRPAYDQMCAAIVSREFDLVMVWSVDRLGRSLQELVSFLSSLHAKGVDLYLHQQGIDTTTPAGKAMFQMWGLRRI